MNDHAEKLLRCIPQKVVARLRESAWELPEQQDRSVAVAFVDIESCTWLCEDLLPKEMNHVIETRFSRFFDAVERAGGNVNEIMGDGFMAIFDDDEISDNARAAVTAALEIQLQNRQLNPHRTAHSDPILVNIDIHWGIRLVGFSKFRSSSGERWTYTVSGSVTNIAARLCALATGGELLVSADLVSHIDNETYALESLGAQQLKNVSRPVLTFRLTDSDSCAQ